MFPNRFNGNGYPPALRARHHRSQIADEGIQRLVGVGVGVRPVFRVGRARLGAHHPRPHKGGHSEVAAVPRLDLRQLAGVWVGQVEVAPQHRHVQPLLGKDPPGVQRQTFGQGGVVKGDAFYDLGESQMDAGKALRPGLGRPGFHGLPLWGELRVYVMQPDPDLYHIVSS